MRVAIDRSALPPRSNGRVGAAHAWSGTMVFRLLTLSLVVMGCAHTIARERLFAPLRARLGGHETWFGYLVSCPYCVSHWVAFALVPLTGIYAIEVPYEWGIVSPILRWFLSSILVAVVASFFRIGFYFIDETQGLIRRRERMADIDLEEASQHRH
jgi:hypothetical protein